VKQIFIFLFSFVLLTACQNLLAQPYLIGNRSVTFTDPARSNRSIATTIYYPATATGSNQAFASGTFPVVVFGHGFSMSIAAFTNIWNFLVPQGYVVVMVNTETGLSPSHSNFGQDLAFCVAKMQSENTTTGSPFYGKLTDKSAIMGHSMGGGCSFLAAANNTLVTTVVGLAPAETNPSAAAAAANITAPILILAGENDCVTPAADHNLLIYNGASSTTCKYYVVINDGIHCDFTNGDGNIPFSSPAFNCYFGGTTCGQGNGSSTNQATQQARMEQAVLPWLAYRLKGNCAQWATFESNITNTTSFSSYQQVCSENPYPTATISAMGNSNCSAPYNGSMLLATDATTFVWSNGATTQNLSNLAAGTYSVTVTKANGCTNSASAAVTDMANLPTAIATPSANTACSAPYNGLVSLNTAATTFLWSNNATTRDLIGVPSGTYTVTITNVNGCTNSISTVVTNNATCAINLQAKVWLEGAYRSNIGKMDTVLRNKNLLPTAQPYNISPWNYGGTESVATLADMPNNVTDWVLVELRQAADTSVVAQKAVWLMNNGWLRQAGATTDGITFNNLNPNNSYFVSIRHRNHLAILSNTALAYAATATIDFTQSNNVANTTNSLSPLGTSYGMVAGDNDANGMINMNDFNGFVADAPNTSINNYAANTADHDLNRIISYRDFNIWRNNNGRNAIAILRY
jgi:dienelactone hydrolase